MAKKAPLLSKADAIRQYEKENPTAGPKVISAALTKQGYKGMSPQYVSTIRSMDKKKSGQPMGKRGPAAKRDILATDLVAAKELVEKLGGVDRAIETLGLLKQLA